MFIDENKQITCYELYISFWLEIKKLSPLPVFDPWTHPVASRRANHWAMMTWWLGWFSDYKIIRVRKIISLLFISGSKFFPNYTSSRHPTSLGLYQPQVWWTPGCQDPPKMSISSQSTTGLQPGQGRSHTWSSDVQRSS